MSQIKQFINTKVWQADGSFAGSFAIKNNSVYSVSGLTGSADSSTGINLNSKLVLPGFFDGHLHLVYGSLMRKRIDSGGVNTFEELKNKIIDFMNTNPEKFWLVGGHLDISKVLNDIHQKTDKSIRTLLDEIVSSKPVFIANYDYHSGLCNTKALELSGVIENLQEYTDDEIARDENGKPTGLVKEKAKDFIFYNIIPLPTTDEIITAVEEMISVLHSFGITSVCDITKKEDFEIYVKLYETGKLKIRVNSYIPFPEFDNFYKYKELTKVVPEELFSIKGFKSYYDGALGSETALFKSNYNGKSFNGYKTEFAENGIIYKLAKEIDKMGKQVIIHAIGDKAVSDVLDIFEELVKENGVRDRRFRIEHAQHIDKKDFDRFKKMNVIASVQPIHLMYDAKIVKEKLPEEIVKRTHNYKQLIDRGVIVSFGTDFPVVGVNPFENIQLAVTRDVGGEIFFPENKIPLNECIRAYTVMGAYASFNENKAGSIKKDNFADFIIMDTDTFEMPENELSNSKVWKTYFNGEEVYSSSE